MPIRIDHRTAQQVVLGSQHVALAVHLNQRSAMISADMKRHTIGIGAVGHVAVHTLTQQLGVLDNSRLLKVRQVTLKDSHMAVHLISRSNTAIGKSPLGQVVFADIHLEVFILEPLAILLHADSKGQFAALVGSRQVVPLFNIKTSPVAVGMQFAAL